MPKVTEQKEAVLRRTVRDAMALDPLISLRSLASVIEKKLNRHVDLEYISKLVKKVNGEIAVHADREKVEEKIAEMRERNRILIEELMRFAYPAIGRMVMDKDRLKAIELIAKIQQTQAKLEMDFGLYARHLGHVDVDHRLKPLDEDTRSNVVRAFESWGLKPPEMRKIEPIVKITEVKPIVANEPPKQPTNAGKQAIPVSIGNGLISTE